ncbi:MAG TPA: hypothetical protein PKC83_13175 [Gemmatimonadaceae bacterium]|nr:hypothetical protein [Gemmatimonadaceae bacterium]
MVLCLAMLGACGHENGSDALIEDWRLQLAEQSVPWGVVDCGAAITLWSGRSDTLYFVDPGARVIHARHVLGWAPLAVGCASDDAVIALGEAWIARVRVDGSSEAPQVGHALAAQYRLIAAAVDGEGVRVVAIDRGGRAVLLRRGARVATPSRIPFARDQRLASPDAFAITTTPTHIVVNERRWPFRMWSIDSTGALRVSSALSDDATLDSMLSARGDIPSWYAGPLVRVGPGFLLSLQNLRTDQSVVLRLLPDLRIGRAQAFDSPIAIVDASRDGTSVYGIHHLQGAELVVYRLWRHP